MKAFLILGLAALAFCVKTEHSFTRGMVPMDNNVAAVPMSINLNYRGEGTIDITLTYTTEYLLDETMWVDETVWGKFESELDSWYDDEMDEVYL